MARSEQSGEGALPEGFADALARGVVELTRNGRFERVEIWPDRVVIFLKPTANDPRQVKPPTGHEARPL